MKNMRNQARTMISQKSEIDYLSKIQNSFLQRFFSYLLADNFQTHFTNAFDREILQRKLNHFQKSLFQDLFSVQRTLVVSQFQHKVDKYLRSKAPSFLDQSLSKVFSIRSNNTNQSQKSFEKGELIFITTKIKIDIEKLTDLPKHAINYLESLNYRDTTILQCNKAKYFNLIIVYYGDVNFNLIKKRGSLARQQIEIYGIKKKLRIIVCFVSKLALVECFKTINKIENLDCINDLVIQYYELKREKNRRKKIKNSQISKKRIQQYASANPLKNLRVASAFIGIGIGIAVGVAVVFKRIYT